MKNLLIVLIALVLIFTGCKRKDVIKADSYDEEAYDESFSEIGTIKIYICGCVISPGIVELTKDSRVGDAIDAAGGLTEDASVKYINLADFLFDGQKVYIPSIMEETEGSDDGLININTADVKELTSLPGIGETRAKDIISYVSSKGPFNSIEDIKKVPGIKDGIFNNIKALIKVR